MGTTVSSGSATINGEVTTTITGGGLVGLPITLITANHSGSSTSTIGTVPANKTWRVYWAMLSEVGAVTNDCTASIKLDGTKILEFDYQGIAMANPGTPVSIPGLTTSFAPNYVELSEGDTITLVSSGIGAVYTGTVAYSEVDVSI